MFSVQRRLGLAAAITVAFVLSLAACGGHTVEPAANGGSTTSPSASAAPGPSSPSAQPSRPAQPSASAAGQLAGFFAAAQAADSRIHHATGLVNSGIGKKTMRFNLATSAAIDAIDVASVEDAIPAGMPPELLRRVLLAYSDLESRARAFSLLSIYKQPTTVQVNGEEGRGILRCLKRGAPAAARFDSDLASARAYAGTVAPLAVPAPGSRAAGELAVQIALINLANSGCAGCGGAVFTRAPTVLWQPKTEPGMGHSDGYVNHVQFRADYHVKHGWEVQLWAC